MERRARVVTEAAFDVTVACTQRLTNGFYGLSLRRTGRATRRAGRIGGSPGAEAGMVDTRWWIHRGWIYHQGCRGEGSSCRWCSSHQGQTGEVLPQYIAEWEGGGGKGERRGSTRARRNLSSAVGARLEGGCNHLVSVGCVAGPAS